MSHAQQSPKSRQPSHSQLVPKRTVIDASRNGALGGAPSERHFTKVRVRSAVESAKTGSLRGLARCPHERPGVEGA